eukprot:XP_001710175.1 Hypothetical protein GL50803_34068 [Giardia lamblia ATCC 50803]
MSPFKSFLSSIQFLARQIKLSIATSTPAWPNVALFFARY